MPARPATKSLNAREWKNHQSDVGVDAVGVGVDADADADAERKVKGPLYSADDDMKRRPTARKMVGTDEEVTASVSTTGTIVVDTAARRQAVDGRLNDGGSPCKPAECAYLAGQPDRQIHAVAATGQAAAHWASQVGGGSFFSKFVGSPRQFNHRLPQRRQPCDTTTSDVLKKAETYLNI